MEGRSPRCEHFAQQRALDRHQVPWSSNPNVLREVDSMEAQATRPRVGHGDGRRIALQCPPQARRYRVEQILKFQMGGDGVVDVEDQPQTISCVASLSQEDVFLANRGRRHRVQTFGGHASSMKRSRKDDFTWKVTCGTWLFSSAPGGKDCEHMAWVAR